MSVESDHRVIQMDSQILGQGLFGGGLEDSWFQKYVFNSLADSLYLAHARGSQGIKGLDVRDIRGALASMLLEACNKDTFFSENAGLKPEPNEDDRLAAIEYISFTATLFGLLNSPEVEQIRMSEGRIPLHRFMNREEIKSRTKDQLLSDIAKWKQEGYLIGECQFAADPPNPTHLYMLTQSYLWAKQNNKKMKLLVGVDSDDFLKRRKQTEEDPRPRMPIEKRREILESFWMLNGSYEIDPNTTDWADLNWWSGEYQKRGTNFVFLVDNQEDMSSRVRRIEKANAKVVKIPHLGSRVTSTKAAQLARMK